MFIKWEFPELNVINQKFLFIFFRIKKLRIKWGGGIIFKPLVICMFMLYRVYMFYFNDAELVFVSVDLRTRHHVHQVATWVHRLAAPSRAYLRRDGPVAPPNHMRRRARD